MDVPTSSWQGRRALVIGCTEFLGAEVTRELIRRGAEVVGLVRERVQGAEFVSEIADGRFHLMHGDSRDAARLHSAMTVHEVSAVFHLRDRDTNSIERAARLYHSRVPLVRTRPTHRLSLADSREIHSPLIGTARFDELFGPGDRDTTRVIARAQLALAGLGTGRPSTSAVRDYVFIRDAARACVELAENVGRAGHSMDRSYRSGWEFSDAQMMKALEDAIGGLTPVPATRVPSEKCSLQPERPFAEVIAETVAWYREYAHSISMARRSRRAA